MPHEPIQPLQLDIVYWASHLDCFISHVFRYVNQPVDVLAHLLRNSVFFAIFALFDHISALIKVDIMGAQFLRF